MNTASFIASSLHVLSRRISCRSLTTSRLVSCVYVNRYCIDSTVDTRVEGLETRSCEYLQSTHLGTIWSIYSTSTVPEKPNPDDKKAVFRGTILFSYRITIIYISLHWITVRFLCRSGHYEINGRRFAL